MRKIAIIGIGPRGLYALEQFLNACSKEQKLKTFQLLLFNYSQYPGAGEVWNPEQPHTNWMNISERALRNLPGRTACELDNLKIPAFPSYREWSAKKATNATPEAMDTFPPRAKMGNYLHQRFQSIIDILVTNKTAVFNKAKIQTLVNENNGFLISDVEKKIYSADEVLLTIGHQPIETSEQLQNWMAHTVQTKKALLFKKAYPVSKITDTEEIHNNSIIGLRGFGLATIDVIRALTIGKGGQFKLINERTREVEFITTDMVPRKLVPFSLDGLPLAAKPISSKVDEKFEPTASEIKSFGKEISKALSAETKTTDITFLTVAIARIASRVYEDILKEHGNAKTNREEIGDSIKSWLHNPKFEHSLIFSKTKSVSETISAFIAMATGTRVPSLDYCVGQVWRHCQPTLYKVFSHAQLKDEVIADIIALDERIKRYSYGPPVESMQQLLALQKVGILDLDFINDPYIKLVASGWELQSNNTVISCNVMVNCVLDGPKLLKVKANLVKNLLQDDLIKPLHTALGIDTRTDGRVRSEENKTIPIAVLGRLSKGSVIGVDAILECFGPRTRDWAKAAVERMYA
ncbi:hypothetical protein EJ994_07790 [Maribacter sp. MJ134]|uniref:FAD/NAD(P)-binding protein n=1 Tax=Maribacter sp. MJ134 TaxID=2496865 RepID=UPI000F822FBD|nr:FAD/NAD(P)-binding domain-containing protein [Maribacter sp. MJ134]AZQ58707.1 hypothetical protein EJ994_07790 [Maribacter sp. MJ134]